MNGYADLLVYHWWVDGRACGLGLGKLTDSKTVSKLIFNWVQDGMCM